MSPDLGVALDDVARGDCAMATAKFAEIDAALTSSPEEAALRARGLILAISGALTHMPRTSTPERPRKVH